MTWIFSILNKFCKGGKKENERLSTQAMKADSCHAAFLLQQVKYDAAAGVTAGAKQIN